jgi:hypothetical protein
MSSGNIGDIATIFDRMRRWTTVDMLPRLVHNSALVGTVEFGAVFPGVCYAPVLPSTPALK